MIDTKGQGSMFLLSLMTDDKLQEYRLRMCARMDEMWLRFPGEQNEALHTRWCKAHNVWYKRYTWAEDELIEREVELEPIPPTPTEGQATQ